MREVIVLRIEAFGLPGWLVPDYWFMLTLAIVTGCLVTLAVARRFRPAAPVSDLLFFGVFGLFIGAKFFYALQFGFTWDLDRFLQPSGFSLYGGLAGLLATWLVYWAFRPFEGFAFLDCVTPGLAAGLFLGRIGCFLAGCNGGLACGLPWGVRFPPETSAYRHQLLSGLIEDGAERSLPAHPTQLYESFFGLLALVFLLYLLRRRKWHGEIFLTGMIWYSVFRFASEWLRADGGGVRPLGVMTFAQFLSLLVLAGAVGLYARSMRKPPIIA